LVDRLVAGGHEHFVILSGPDDNYVSNQRVEAARSRLADHKLRATVVLGRLDHGSGEEGLRRALAAHPRTDALICVNDVMAIGAMDAARNEYGFEVPRDISIVGFDGVEPAAWPSYQLTTIRQPVQAMTEAAVNMLVERICDPDIPPEDRSFAGALIVGRSARLGPFTGCRVFGG
jgi:DNA-binding LacI/PurR family transcriptional regulator